MDEPPSERGASALRAGPRSVRVWDPATRLFHWALVILVAVNIYTGSIGGLWEMDLHMKSGYAILTLVLFRVVWGLVGSRHSRFADFVRGPAVAVAYLRRLRRGGGAPVRGHTPLGGWSVMAMLVSLLVQATTGLYANDDIFTEGPLAKTVSKATSDTLTWVHDVNSNILFVLIGVHLLAVFGYLLVKRDNLIRPMITGRKVLPPGTPAERTVDDPPFASPWRAAVVLACAAALVWAVVGR
jgi:cytochrome b